LAGLWNFASFSFRIAEERNSSGKAFLSRARSARCLRSRSSAIRWRDLAHRARVSERDTTSSMNSASMRTTILWLHAVGGVAWVGAAAVFVIASSAVGIEDEEGIAMMRRIAPVINRIGLAAMLFIVISGIVNIYIAGL